MIFINLRATAGYRDVFLTKCSPISKTSLRNNLVSKFSNKKGSAEGTAGQNHLLNLKAPDTEAGTLIKGYYNSDNKQVAEVDGKLIKNVDGYTDADGNWKYSFNELRVTKPDENGNRIPISYRISEDPLQGYETSVDGFNVINTLISYTVTVTGDENGTATAEPGSGVPGEQVTLTATPNEGYQFKEWQIVSETDGELEDAAADTTTFTIGTS